ncbi:MAG: hypothetical protein J6K63_05065 [Clostridia bacterium]|nr:hypothetical protein [Clostridia bacterium]
MKDLTSGNIYKAFFLFSIPLILSSILSQAFGIIDTSIAGLFLGSKGLAALGASSSAIVVVEAFFWGMNAGIGVYLSGAFGEKNYEEFKKIVVSNRIFIFAVTSTLALLAIILNGPILKFLNVEDVIYIDSRNYFILMFINMPFALITHLYIYIFSSMGMSSFPMYISMASSVINIVGNILSVTVLDIGVIGLGLSTVISTIISFLLYTIKIRKCYKEMEVDKLSCRFNFKYVKRVFPAAIPNGAQQLSMYLAGFIISPIKNGLGYTAIASLSIVGKVESMMSLFYGNCARTISTYIPQCVGAKKYHKIKKAIGVSFIQSLVFVIPVMLVIWLFPQIICLLFFNSETEAEVIQNVVTYIKIFMPFMFFHAFSNAFHNVFRGLKNSTQLLISTSLCSVASIILAFTLCPIMGIKGYYLQAALSWIIECIYIVIVYVSGKWIPKPLRPMILGKKTSESSE